MKEKSTIALVDDERNILTSLGMALEAELQGAHL
jgi:two-component system, OmpR family, response regulator ChvI